MKRSLLAALFLLTAGCPHKSPPEPATDAAPAPSASSLPAFLKHQQPPDASDPIPQPKRDPDWGLDPGDPAADYVGRYIRATNRYGAKTACVVVGKSQVQGTDSAVEVRNDASGTCGAANELRETFLVNVGADRLHLQDPKKHDPLQKWPDMSDPEGPANPTQEVADLLHWKAPLRDAIKALLLVPIRVQWYGRGTYPVITIADWHGTVSPKAPAEQLSLAAQKICAATGNQPVGIFAGFNRIDVLRILCPDKTRWDQF